MLAHTSVRRLALLASLVLLAGPARAQFGQFTWTFSATGTGSGSVSPFAMIIHGPDASCCASSVASFMSVAPYDLVLVVDYDVENFDKAGPDYDYLVAFDDRGMQYVAGDCFGCQLVLEVSAGSSFGFGVFSADSFFGGAVATLTNLLVQPAPHGPGAAGTATGGQFGAALATLSDVQGDGAPEIAVGAPGVAAEKGRVTVHDGANFAVVRTFDGAAAGDRFGAALAGVGDQDGDGFVDLLVGAPRSDVGYPNGGAVRLYSLATGLLAELPGSASADEFGRALADAGDVDGDGLHDLLIDAPRHDGVGADSGQVVILAGGTYALLASWEGAAAGDQFGSAVAGVGDLDGDGVPDVAIGTPLADMLATNSGRAQLFSGATGALLHELAPLSCNGDTGDHFGSAVAGVGDVDGDGTPDVAVGVPGESCSGNGSSGALRVYSGADGQLLTNVFGANNEGFLGQSLAGPGDANVDGVPDLLVGSPGFQFPAQTGSALLLSGVDDGVLLGLAGSQFEDGFGSAVAAPGDTNGDGRMDALIGAPATFTGDLGTARLVQPDFLWTDVGHALAGAGTPELDGEGLLAPGTPFALAL
ncbi:MAG TPA: integrin alpha, partial [Planctomycetota bacterium]|nr:integrin alpha [Planctomycetota bacterium]